MELEKTSDCCAINTGSRIHCGRSCRKTSFMASITSQGIKIPSIDAINYIFGQSIGDINSSPSGIPCTHKAHRHCYSFLARSCVERDSRFILHQYRLQHCGYLHQTASETNTSKFHLRIRSNIRSRGSVDLVIE
jgi:hypothetical protein